MVAQQQRLFEMGEEETQPLSPMVVHCKRERYDVYIGRGSKWGNPFSHVRSSKATHVVSGREEAIERYREWVQEQPELMESLCELRGKVLGCWCRPKPCHGDVLLELIEIHCRDEDSCSETRNT